MPQRFFFQLIWGSIGIALLFAGLFFDTSTAVSQIASTPTPDRLAQPTLPASPSQADKGAQVYWLSCLPCHGDRGQGLTEEFKQTYPAEDRNCWNSGCHGKRPYDNGFTLPTTIPPVSGAGTLQKFPTALVLRSYIFAAMPYWRPASLTEEESWQVTAFLLRENNMWDSRAELNAETARSVFIVTAVVSPAKEYDVKTNTTVPIIMMGGVLILVLFFIFQRLRKK